MQANMTPIKVYCRLKPSIDLIKYEIIPTENQLVYYYNNKMEKFQFQKVFDDYTTQSSIFKDVAVPILDKYLSGTNGTIFAYGQTGSGKSHTIYGSRKDAGIIPRSLQYIFDKTLAIQSTKEHGIFSMAYFEIYNETVYDLLTLSKTRHKSNLDNLGPTNAVSFTVNKKGDVAFTNLNIIQVKSVSEAFKQLIHGNARRQVSSTSMNKESSRSHCICRIEYMTRTKGTKSNKTVLNLVDLAGSECISKINNDKQRIAESRYINLSLMHLHRVIKCLASPVKPIYVPYRNSAITRLLKGSLGYNCATAMITMIVLNYRSIVESTSTCKYARDVSGIRPIIIVEPERPKRRVAKKMAKKVNLIADEEKHVAERVSYGTRTVVVNNKVLEERGDNSSQAAVIINDDYKNRGDQMTKINDRDSRPELKVVPFRVQPVHVMGPRMMESGEGVIDNLKATGVDLIGHNVGHSVRDDNYKTSRGTQTAVVTRDVKVMTDIQCGDSRCCRFRRKCVNYLLIIVIMMVLFTAGIQTNELDVNGVRLYSVIENPQQYLNPGSGLVNYEPDSLPTLGDPVRPYEDDGNPQYHFGSCKHNSQLYAKTIQQNYQTLNLHLASVNETICRQRNSRQDSL